MSHALAGCTEDSFACFNRYPKITQDTEDVQNSPAFSERLRNSDGL